MIKAYDIRKAYRGHEIVRGVSLTLGHGQVLGILGPNGAGKTTLLKILSLILKPDSGSLQIAGCDAQKHDSEILPMIGYVPQETALFEELSVRDNLMCWCRLKSRALHEKCRQVARETQIDGFYRKKVRTLSGGMKRRVNLAVALLNDPAILIMDEPLVGVDIRARRHILDLIKKTAAGGAAVIITSHHGEEILQIADYVMLLSGGAAAFYGTKAEFDALGAPSASPDNKILDLLSANEREEKI